MWGIESIQELYQEYQFIEASEASEGEDGTGAIVQWYNKMETSIRRSYEDGERWYFIVFKPLNLQYSSSFSWYKTKGLDKCRKMLNGPSAYLFTREINSTKVHINALVCTTDDLSHKHDTVYCSKYKIYCKLLSNYGDRCRVMKYIVKESRDRSFIQFQDYIVYDKLSGS